MGTKKDDQQLDDVDVKEFADSAGVEAKAEPELEINDVDVFAEGSIPAGATGPSVLRLQEAVGAPQTGVLDRTTTNAIRAAQRAAGVAQTGNVDVATRRMLRV